MFQAGQTGGPRLGVLAHPPVMDESDRDGVQEVQLLPTPAPAHDEAGLLEQAEVLGDADPRHVVAGGQGHQGLTVMLEQCVEQCAPSRIGKRPEHRLHNIHNRKPNGFLSRVDSSVFPRAQDVSPHGRQGDPCSCLFGDVVPHSRECDTRSAVLVAAGCEVARDRPDGAVRQMLADRHQHLVALGGDGDHLAVGRIVQAVGN